MKLTSWGDWGEDRFCMIEPIPHRISEVTDGDQVVLYYKWKKYITLMIFCMILFVVSVQYAAPIIMPHSKKVESIFDFFNAQSLVLLVVYIIPLVLFYRALCQTLNSTRISVGRNRVEILTKPIPTLGNRTIAFDKITQVYVREVIKNTQGTTYKSYQLFYLNPQGQEQILLKIACLEKDTALFLQHRLNELLNITPQPIAGAVQA